MNQKMESVEHKEEARSEAKAMAAQAETVLTVLRARFKRVPKDVVETIRQATDKTVLNS